MRSQPLCLGGIIFGVLACATAPVPQNSIWIGRPDGSLQCQKDKPSGLVRVHSLEEGQRQLEALSVNVFEARKATAPGMRIAQCGTPTGKQNQYRIKLSDLEKVLQNNDLGFTRVK